MHNFTTTTKGRARLRSRTFFLRDRIDQNLRVSFEPVAQPCVSWLFRRTLVSTDRIGVQTMSEQVTNANEQILAAPSELSQQELETVSGGAAVDYFDRASPLFSGKLALNPQPLPPG